MGREQPEDLMVGGVGRVGPVDDARNESSCDCNGRWPDAIREFEEDLLLRGEAGKKQKILFNYKEALKGTSGRVSVRRHDRRSMRLPMKTWILIPMMLPFSGVLSPLTGHADRPKP
jgi:hypothetical protein